MSEGYRTFDHTGDLGLEVWADDPERLFALAAEAVAAQSAEPRARPDVSPGITATLALEGDDAEDLFVHWLNTALLEAEARRAVWTEARVERLGPRSLEARLVGEPLDPARHTLLREIKAISHHGLELNLEPGSCRARMILDL